MLMGLLRPGEEGQPAGQVGTQEVRSLVACPRQVLSWVWEEWDLGQRMGDLQKDMDRRAAKTQRVGLFPGI